MFLHLAYPLRLRPDCHPTDKGREEHWGGRVHEHVPGTTQEGGLWAQDEEGESSKGTGWRICLVQRRLPNNNCVVDGVDGVHRGGVFILRQSFCLSVSKGKERDIE